MDQGKSKHPANPALDERIRRMFGRDRATALFALAGL